jgi:hypothetical protein
MYRMGEVWQAFATSHLTVVLLAIDLVRRLEALCHVPAPSFLPRLFRHQAAKPPSFLSDGLMLVLAEKTPGSTGRWHCDIDFVIFCIPCAISCACQPLQQRFRLNPIHRVSLTLRHMRENKFHVLLHQLGHERTGVRRHVSNGVLVPVGCSAGIASRTV